MKHDAYILDANGTIKTEQAYHDLISSLKKRSGFGFSFVRCSPLEAEQIIAHCYEDFDKQGIQVLHLEQPVENFYQAVCGIPNCEYIKVLFITGAEKFLSNFFNQDQCSVSYVTQIPLSLRYLLAHQTDLEKEFKFRFVFLMPLVALRYFVEQVRDLFLGEIDIFEFPNDIEFVPHDTEHEISEEKFKYYATLSEPERQAKIQEIHLLLKSQAVNAKRRVELLLEQGGLFAVAGDYLQAIVNCDRALAIDGNSYLTWYNRGVAQNGLGEYEAAISSFDIALTFKSDFYPALYNRGLALHLLGSYQLAIYSYEAALAIKSDFYQALNGKASVLVDLGFYSEAIAYYDRALMLEPDYYQAWQGRGYAYTCLYNYREAVACYDKALAIKPENHQIWYVRARVLEHLGCFREAVESYDQVLSLQPNDYYAWNNRGLALRYLQMYEAALFSFEQAITIQPNDIYAWYCLGNVLSDMNRYLEASLCYSKAISIY